MKLFDNRGSSISPVTFSFGMVVNGNRISYTYIRKNACSSFENMFRELSDHDLVSDGPVLRGMIEFHRDSEIEKISSSDFRICVLRDPVERVVSVFKNKFIQMSGNADIFNSFSKATGKDPRETTFREFVKDYVSLLVDSREKVDPHLWRQVDHLFSIQYNAVIPMSGLQESMCEIIGESLSSRFFSQRVNSSVGRPSGNEEIEGCFDVSAIDLNASYIDKGFIPRNDKILDEETRAILSHIYAEDLDLLKVFYVQSGSGIDE